MQRVKAELRTVSPPKNRPIKLRKKADGQWCLWEQYLLTDIRQPKANDPWA